MKLLGIRFCCVEDDADPMLSFFNNGLGLKNTFEDHEGFKGGVFPNQSEDSWIEIWEASEQMPKGIMLQLFVDDVDEYAEHAKKQGLSINGPFEAHGEKMFYVVAPNGMSMSVQSKLS